MKSCRIIALILAMLMAFAILSGCQSEKKTKTIEETKTEEKKEEAKAKEDKPETSDGPTPIVIFFQDDNVNFPQTIDRPNNQKINEIAKEKFNIEIIIETCISSEMESAVNTRLAAGADVPDMITYDFSIQRVSELYDQGLILGLTDLINEHAPELKFRMMEDNPAIMAAHADSDGEILRVPSCEESIQHEIYVMHLRHDWLTKLGIEFPTTPDEFLSVLKAFQDNDMNGNGKKDEIFTPGSVQTLNVSLSSAFDVYGLRNAEKSWYVDDDGKVYNSMVSDAAKDYVAYVAKLAEEGVLDMEFTNQTADMINQKRYNNRVSGTTGAWWDSVVLDVQIAEKVPGATYVPMEPLKSASGKQMILRRNNVGWSPHMITAQCADPVGCIKLLDWCYTKEGTQIL
ncbi:MAG: extracellular solute-binding protein, partial [Clostridiales bacterium]|nr:extracellular solute-binding protein [Clostridiales bacterium]